MMGSREMRRAVLEDVPTILALLQKRIDWMDEKGLYQWNKTAYLTVYPAPYFAERIRENSVFLAVDGDKVIGVIALFDVDPRWDNDKDAYYVHHFATDPAYAGLGREMLTFAETYARNAGKEVLRLDSQKVNDDLSRYYEALGYPAVGECIDGAYVGIKREKTLNG